MINIKELTKNINKKDSTIQKTFFEIVYKININIEENNQTYKNWLNSFIHCYGDLSKENNSANAKKCVETINKLYNIKLENNNLHKFIFSLQSTYTILLKLIVINSFFKKENIEIHQKEFKELMNGKITTKYINKEIWNTDWFFRKNNK